MVFNNAIIGAYLKEGAVATATTNFGSVFGTVLESLLQYLARHTLVPNRDRV